MGAKAPVNKRQPAAAGVQVSQSSLGVTIGVIYGRCRVPGNLIYLGSKENKGFAVFPAAELSAGFGGAAAPAQQKYFYFASLLFALCEGPIEGVRTIYKRDTRIRLKNFDSPVGPPWGPPDTTGSVVIPPNIFFTNINVFLGKNGQPAWLEDFSVAEAGEQFEFLHPDPPLRYPFLALLSRHAWPLYEQAQLPNLTFEVFGLKLEPTVREPERVGVAGDDTFDLVPPADPDNALKVGCNPADIVEDILTDPIHGIGFVDPITKESLLDATALADYRTASKANGWILSLACLERKSVRDYIEPLLQQSNATVYFSDGKLKTLPLADAPATGPYYVRESDQVTHVPSFLVPDGQGGYAVQVQYEITEDDFLPDEDGNTITVTRPNAADAFNSVPVEYLDRANNYAPGVVEAQDLASIELLGRRDAELLTAHEYTDIQIAQRGAQLLLQKETLRSTFKFRVDWRFCRLDPGDLVALTHAEEDIARVVARIVSIDEAEDNETLEMVAEEFITGLATVVRYPRQGSLQEGLNFEVDPGKIYEPVIFEPVAELGGGDLEVWVAVTGQSKDWGGCTIHLSEDGGVEYRVVGRISKRARMGKLHTRLLIADDELAVQMTAPPEVTVVLPEFTVGELQRITGPCLIDGSATNPTRIPYEILAYADAELTAPNRYSLTPLVRGAMGTPTEDHQKGSNFVFLDDAVFRLELPARLLDPTKYVPLRFKFTSFNVFGGEEQALEDVPPVLYRLTGTVLLTPVGAIQNLQAEFVSVADGHELQLTWTPVTDLRGIVDYEVRRGTGGWERAVRIDETRNPRINVMVDGAYWVAARVSVTAFGEPRYVYGAPAAIAIKGADDLVRNVVRQFDELPLQWSSYIDQVAADALDSVGLAWWRLGIDQRYPLVFDEMTQSNVGTYSLAAPNSQLQQVGAVAADGVDNRAVLFDDANDLVLLPAHARNNLGDDGTLLWFFRRFTPAATQQYLYSKGGGAWMTIEANHRIRWLAGTSSTQLTGATDVTTLPGDWHCVALTWRRFDPDGMETRRIWLYLDGELEAATTGALFPVTTGDTWLGNRGSPVAGALDGLLDEFVKLPSTITPHQARSFFRAAREFQADRFVQFVKAQTPDVYLRFNEVGDHHAREQLRGFHGTYSSTLPPVAAGLIGGDPDWARSFNGAGTHWMTFDADGNGVTPGSEVAIEVTCTPAAAANMFLCGWHNLGNVNEGVHIRLTAAGAIVADFVSPDGGSWPVIANSAYAAGQKLTIVAQVDGVFRTLWVNGQFGGGGIHGQPLKTNADFHVGRAPAAGGFGHFNGVIDDVIIYALGLPQGRVEAHASAVLGAQPLTGLQVKRPENYLRAKPNTTGYFQVPDAHMVTLARHAVVRIVAGWDVVAIGPESIRDEPDIMAVGQVKVIDAAPLIIAEAEVSMSGDATGNDWTHGGLHPEWIKYRPSGIYSGRRFRMRFKLGSLAAGVIAELRAFQWGVDVPDLIQRGTVTTAGGGLVHVAYAKAYQAPEGLPAIFTAVVNPPNPTQIEVVRTINETATGFDVEVVTIGGTRVSRVVNWTAQGY